MATMRTLLLVALLALVAAALSVRAASVGLGALVSNDEFRERRLRNLAETIAELQAEAAEEALQAQQGRAMIEAEPIAVPAAPAAAPAAPVAAPVAAAAPAAAAPAAPAAPTMPRVASKFQGVARGDLVALYRFDDPAQPGRGIGGSGRSLKVFGSGVQVVTGKDAKRGRGSLFIAPAKGKAKSDSAFLAKDEKGTPLKGLPAGGSSFTLAAWYKVSASQQQSGSFGILSYGKRERGQASLLKATASGRAVATLFGQEGLASNNTEEPLEHAQWHHAAVVYDNSTRTQTMFSDGRVSSRRVLAEAPNVAAEGTGAAFFLGLSANVDGAESEQFAGFLDDVAIFRVALLEAEVRRIARGSFTPYLDLYSLRGCTTRVGRRYHGGTFVRGAADEHVSIDNDKFKYGFQADSQLTCSLKCAQTTNCRQAVFMADGAEAAATGADAASQSKRAGRCFLMSVSYTSFAKDPAATTTTCRTPSAALQKVSFNLKLSADFDAQLALRDARLLKAKTAAKKFGNKAKSLVSAKKDAKAKGKGKDSAAEVRSVKAKERLAAKAAVEDAKLSLKERYERKIAALQRKVKEQAAALKAAKVASKAQSRAQKAAAAESIAALKARTKKLSKALAQKASEADLIAQAEAIRLAADAQADKIVRAAQKKADEIRRRHARKLKKAAKKTAKKAAKKAARKAEKAMERALTKMAKKAGKSAKKAVKKSAKEAAKKKF